MNLILEPKATLEQPLNQSLHEVFVEELARIYDAEKQLTTALPILATAARSVDLKALLKIHLQETKGHVQCIKQVAESLGEQLPRKSCHAIKNMIREGVVLLVKERGTPVLDAALIAAAQKIEHYEIAAYGTLCAWARQLGLEHEFAMLESTLEQEKNADTLLTGVAVGAGPLAELVERLSLKKAGATSLQSLPEPPK